MEKKHIFKGIATALVTPFHEDGSVDYDSLGKLIDWQIECGIDGLVIAGTSGEGSTLEDVEHRSVVEYSVKRASGRCPIIAGTGSNDMAYALELTDYCVKAGCDAVLVVTPYYNKATQNGLIKMYERIADESEVPVILYNVPSRTGINIEPSTYAALAEHQNIVGIKEANGNIAKIVETMSLVNGKLDLYSGNDDQILPLMSLGGIGAISVISNIMPIETRQICSRFFSGDIKGSAELQYRYHSLIDALFCEVNPIPVKAAVSAMGFCKNVLRMPLTQMEDDHYRKLIALMREQGLEV